MENSITEFFFIETYPKQMHENIRKITLFFAWMLDLRIFFEFWTKSDKLKVRTEEEEKISEDF